MGSKDESQEKAMKCVMCKHGETVAGTATLPLERGDSMIVFKDVPARVCENCGEKYFEDKIITSLLRKAEELADSGAEVDVRKYQVA